MSPRDLVTAGLIAGCLVFAGLSVHVEHAAVRPIHRLVTIPRAELQGWLNHHGSRGWELIELEPTRTEDSEVVAVFRRSGLAPSVSAPPPPPAKKKGDGRAPTYEEPSL